MKKYVFLVLLLASGLAQAEPHYSADYNSCMDQAAGVTANVITCIGTEATAQDKKLNENYKTLKQKLTPERQKQLLEVQRLWLQFREANCKFYNDPDGGSMQRILANECFLKLTAQRAQELADLRYPM